MKVFNRLTMLTVASAVALGLTSGSTYAVGPAGLTTAEAEAIFDACQDAANAEPSPIRGAGNFTKMWCAVINREGTLKLLKATDTGESPGNVMATDAWRVSIEVAPAKAFTAVSTSSNDTPLTSRLIGEFSALPPTDPGTLWGIGDTNPYRPGTGNTNLNPDDLIGKKHHGIVTFPGGVPVYDNPDDDCPTIDPADLPGTKGKLVGAVGVSGDTVDADENVAEGAVTGAGFCLNP